MWYDATARKRKVLYVGEKNDKVVCSKCFVDWGGEAMQRCMAYRPDLKLANKIHEQNPDGEGILKGVNYLDATYHVGVNTVGQSLRNANLNLRAEPPNPRVAVSPWLNSTIDTDLSRKTLGDNLN